MNSVSFKVARIGFVVEQDGRMPVLHSDSAVLNTSTWTLLCSRPVSCSSGQLNRYTSDRSRVSKETTYKKHVVVRCAGRHLAGSLEGAGWLGEEILHEVL